MRMVMLGAFLVAACSLGLAGCGGGSTSLNTASTIRWDSARDGEPKDMGGPPPKGGSKGKGSGAGAAAPP